MVLQVAAGLTPKLEDQAATAALLATKSAQTKNKTMTEGDSKLSAASAASSLRFAEPKSLPSYTIVGLGNIESSAGAAVSMANRNQKPLEAWKPTPSASASAAAMHAKDVHAPEVWSANTSSQGAKAALLAFNEDANVDVWKPEKSTWGSSAANLAFRGTKGNNNQPDAGYSTEGKKRSLRAAVGAMSSNRKRADSTPILYPEYPDSSNAASNALNAATLANKPLGNQPSQSPKVSPPLMDINRLHNAAVTNMSREMYTSNPPVSIEVEERNKKDVMRAAAVSMAKQMYDVQRKHIGDANNAAKRANESQFSPGSVRRRRLSIESSDTSEHQPMRFNSIEEAARKLASERLAKLHDEHAAYRAYYGQTPARMRPSLLGKQRRRASSDGSNTAADREQSLKIRSQMTMFTSQLAKVDAGKQQVDREALMAAAQRNVSARMSTMDKKIYSDTGKITPSMMEEWELKARATAEAESKSRMTNYGKVAIGGGKYVEQSDVDAVAAKNVQPFLDEINSKAEKHRALEEEARLDEERRKLTAEEEKARGKDMKDELKRLKGIISISPTERLNLTFKEREKLADRTKKEEEKAKKAQERRMAKENKGKSQEAFIKGPSIAQESESHGPARTEEDQQSRAVEGATAEIVEGKEAPTKPVDTGALLRNTSPAEELIGDEKAPEPVSPKQDSKVRSWIKGKFRRSGKSEDLNDEGYEKGFMGGAALAAANTSSTSLNQRDLSLREQSIADKRRSSSDRIEVDSAYQVPHIRSAHLDNERRPRSRAISPSPVSPLSETGDTTFAKPTDDGDEKFEEARDYFEEELVHPPTIGASKRISSPIRDSRFVEDL
ncbi:MAG: hypothetical protein M1829_003285 [Trizodia sp. TS-e1964]|nr:MAG: hypothetical protein M1829_003285 [Trizodia sp. TS-e1964]